MSDDRIWPVCHTDATKIQISPCSHAIWSEFLLPQFQIIRGVFAYFRTKACVLSSSCIDLQLIKVYCYMSYVNMHVQVWAESSVAGTINHSNFLHWSHLDSVLTQSIFQPCIIKIHHWAFLYDHLTSIRSDGVTRAGIRARYDSLSFSYKKISKL